MLHAIKARNNVRQRVNFKREGDREIKKNKKQKQKTTTNSVWSNIVILLVQDQTWKKNVSTMMLASIANREFFLINSANQSSGVQLCLNCIIVVLNSYLASTISNNQF